MAILGSCMQLQEQPARPSWERSLITQVLIERFWFVLSQWLPRLQLSFGGCRNIPRPQKRLRNNSRCLDVVETRKVLLQIIISDLFDCPLLRLLTVFHIDL